jgi:hypothetical protein
VTTTALEQRLAADGQQFFGGVAGDRGETGAFAAARNDGRRHLVTS